MTKSGAPIYLLIKWMRVRNGQEKGSHYLITNHMKKQTKKNNL